MDIQRVLILLGLAVTSYMLILAWNEDYYQGSTETPAESVVINESSSLGDILPTITESTPVGPADIVPTLEGEDIARSRGRSGEQKPRDRHDRCAGHRDRYPGWRHC